MLSGSNVDQNHDNGVEWCFLTLVLEHLVQFLRPFEKGVHNVKTFFYCNTKILFFFFFKSFVLQHCTLKFPKLYDLQYCNRLNAQKHIEQSSSSPLTIILEIFQIVNQRYSLSSLFVLDRFFSAKMLCQLLCKESLF